MRAPLCIFAMLVALAAGVPVAAVAQTPDLPDDTPGVSQQAPVPLDGEGAPAQPEPGPTTPQPAQPAAGDALPNTGVDTVLLALAGAMVTLLGVALRLRTADAPIY